AAMRAALANLGLHLRDLHPGHHASSGASASGAGGIHGRTSLICFPRILATSSGRRSSLSAAIVAFAMLIGLVVPRLFASTLRTPASSSTARTPPPAITPVPSEAGRSITRAASNRPSTAWVIVDPCFGTVYRFFFRSSTRLVIGGGPSPPLPSPTPTRSISSPTTTSAVNENRRPP